MQEALRPMDSTGTRCYNFFLCRKTLLEVYNILFYRSMIGRTHIVQISCNKFLNLVRSQL